MRKQVSLAVVAILLIAASVRGQDAKFVDDNLKFSREFYAKVHFVAVAGSPGPFKYDRYPGKGAERFQCEGGTYLRQHGQSWKHVDQPMRTGLPITYGEMDRYVMTLAGKDQWGKSGAPVEKVVAEKLAGWIRLIDAAFAAQTGELKVVDKSEAADRAQWIFEVAGAGGSPTRLTFRKPANEKAENVLLHEFSGGGAADSVHLGFGYMMPFQDGQEVSEFVWEEMHR